MSALMEIIIKAIDKSSDVAKKVESNLKGMGDKASKALDKASQSGDKFTESLKKTGTSGMSAYAQLTAKQQSYLTGLSKGQQLTDRLGMSGTKAGNLLSTGIDRAHNAISRVKTGVDSLKQKIESTTVGSKLIAGFDSLSSKASAVGSKIKTALGNGLDSAKTKVENLTGSMGELGTAVTSVFGALGMGSIYDATIGLGMVREQMTTLMTATMGSGSAAKGFVTYLDQMTNNSLVSLNDLGNAMSKIKMSTGMTNDELKLISPTVNDIGQRALLMGKSTGEAQDLMVASFRGLNGEFDMLKTNFGITKQSLVDAGWSGAATDVAGYNAAMQKVLAQGGSMDGMLQSTTGQIQLVKKGFSTAGRQIGEAFLPAIKVILSFMVSLKQTNPLVFKLMIVGAALISAFALLLPVMASIIGSFKSFLIFVGLVEGAENATTLATVRSTIATKAGAVADKAAAAGKAIFAAAQTVYNFAVGEGTIATKAAAVAQWLLNVAMDANPIMIVVIAIVALVAILAYLYQNNETVRNAINALWNGLKVLGGYIAGGLMAAWNAISGVLSAVGSFLMGTFIAAWNGLKTALSPITSALGTLWAALSKVFGAFAGGQAAKAGSTFNTITNYARALWAVISGALMPVFKTWYTILVQVGTFVGGFFSAAWTTISGVLSAVIGFIAGFINVLTGLVSGTMTMSEAAGAIWNLFKGMIMRILGSIMMGIGLWVTLLIQKGRNAALGFVNGLINYIKSLPGRIWAYLMYTLQRIQNFANSARERARQAGSQIVSGLRNAVSQAPGAVYTELTRIGGRILSVGGQLYNNARSLGANIVNSLKKGLGIASPGHMYWAVHDELDRITNVFGKKESALSSAAAALGSSISDSFSTSASADVDLSANMGSVSKAVSSSNTSNNNGSNSKTEINLNINLKNVPQGNSDKNIVSMLIEGLKDRKVQEALDISLKKRGNYVKAGAGRG